MPVLMVDSEGGALRYRGGWSHELGALVAASSDGYVNTYAPGHSIGTLEVLAWLTSLPENYLVCGYSLGYDYAMWLRDLSTAEHAYLRRSGGDAWLGVGPYRINITGNRLTVTRKNADGTRRTVQVHDVFKFFQSSFLNAIGHDKGGWRIVTPEELAVITAGKENRSGFTLEYASGPECVAYSVEECRVGSRLVERLRVAVEEALGEPLKQYFGAGSLAKLLLRKHEVTLYQGDGGYPPETPPDVKRAVMHAYFGGRFESGCFGPVRGLDVEVCSGEGCRIQPPIHRPYGNAHSVRLVRVCSNCARPRPFDRDSSGVSLPPVQHELGMVRETTGRGGGVPHSKPGGSAAQRSALRAPSHRDTACSTSCGTAESAEVALCDRCGLPRGVQGTLAHPVTEYDLTSAYPAQMRKLPCLTHASWVRVGADRRYLDGGTAPMYSSLWHVRWNLPDANPWAPFPFRQPDGTITCPRRGEGWYWREEVEAALDMFPTIEVIDGYVLVKSCQCRPFDWVPEVYDWRMQRGDKNDGPGIVAKLGLNSLYGACAQSVGHPTFQSFVWAGIITSNTRAALLRAIARDPEAVFMVATDAVYSTRPLPGLETPGLGGWEVQRYDDAFVVAPGVALLGGKVKSRGLAKRDFSRVAEPLREAWALMGPMATVTARTTRFIGLGAGLSRPEAYCQWEVTDRTMGIGAGSKREHPPVGGLLGWPEPYWTLPALGDGSMSAAYDKRTVSPEAQAAREALFEVLDQPDPDIVVDEAWA